MCAREWRVRVCSGSKAAGARSRLALPGTSTEDRPRRGAAAGGGEPARARPPRLGPRPAHATRRPDREPGAKRRAPSTRQRGGPTLGALASLAQLLGQLGRRWPQAPSRCRTHPLEWRPAGGAGRPRPARGAGPRTPRNAPLSGRRSAEESSAFSMTASVALIREEPKHPRKVFAVPQVKKKLPSPLPQQLAVFLSSFWLHWGIGAFLFSVLAPSVLNSMPSSTLRRVAFP